VFVAIDHTLADAFNIRREYGELAIAISYGILQSLKLVF